MMNENNRVTITICGKEYTLQTDESPDYVRQLAARLDRRISDMMETSDIISLSSAAILVGLSLMDDSYKTTTSAVRSAIMWRKRARRARRRMICAVSWRRRTGRSTCSRPNSA